MDGRDSATCQGSLGSRGIGPQAGSARLPSLKGLIQEEESALCLSPGQRHQGLNTGRESSPALRDQAGGRSRGGG